VLVWPRDYRAWNRADFAPSTFGAAHQEPGFALYPNQCATRVTQDRDGTFIELRGIHPPGPPAGPPNFGVHVKIPLTMELMVRISRLLYARTKAALNSTSALERAGAGQA